MLLRVSKLLPLIIISCFLSGCVSAPKGFLKFPETYLEKRQLQIRQYDTTDEEKIIISVAGVLQDLGFMLDDSETEVGLVVASKKADATDGGQIATAFFIDLLAALGGSYSNASANVDAVQHVKASVIVKPSLEGGRTVVRVTFQRIVWNVSNKINRVETVDEPEIYQKFFDSLSKSIFLEAHSI
ncbi:MAG: hypothetical protein PHU64_00345 [Candidatus Omnitrophica bacterium]|nr:hypothetical protein [Candidatus Omnitrophota bacterium]MDD5429654.1 hypothetical protein [Candidatus Omnitrophota bacterium]